MSHSITLNQPATLSQMLRAAAGELRAMLAQRNRPAAIVAAAPVAVKGRADTSSIWQLYRMTAGADSVRPAVLAKLAAEAKR